MDNGQRFAAHGLFVVEHAVPAAALAWVRETLGRFIGEQLEADTAAPEVGVVEREGRRYVISIDELFANLGALPLYLMGLPAVVEAARAACGDGAACTHGWMVVKNDGDGQRVDWHQDFVHDGRFPAINIGIQLDDARADAVRFIPGPRRGAEDVCALAERYAHDSPELVSAEVSAGGLTVHDVLLVHGSPPLSGQRWRRTLYLEFRGAEMVAEHPLFTPEYIALRRRLLEAAQRLVARVGDAPTGDPFDLADEDERAAIEALKGARQPVEPANYCHRR